jgi:RNA polymerase sigma-32 factor
MPIAPSPVTAAGSVLEGEIVEADEPLPLGALAAVDLLGIPDALSPEGDLMPPPEDLELAVRAGPHGEELVPLAGGRAVLVRDALTRYLADVSRYPRLTPEREHDLAVRGREGDRAALAELVTSNLRLVVAVALSFRRAFANVLDLIQEGNLGLLEAIDRFDPYHGTRLSTYATFWIRSRMVKYLLDNWRLVRVGTTNARRKLLYGLRQEKERLEREGLAPTPKLLASRMGVSEEDVVAVSRAVGARDSSLDAPLSDATDTTRGDVIPSAAPSPEREVADRELKERLAAALEEVARTLSPREQALLRERLLADEPVTLQEIADREGVTREAVRQSEARLVSRLRAYLQERFPEAAEIRFWSG